MRSAFFSFSKKNCFSVLPPGLEDCFLFTLVSLAKHCLYLFRREVFFFSFNLSEVVLSKAVL